MDKGNRENKEDILFLNDDEIPQYTSRQLGPFSNNTMSSNDTFLDTSLFCNPRTLPNSTIRTNLSQTRNRSILTRHSRIIGINLTLVGNTQLSNESSIELPITS
jgi:hypothetical protein